MAQRNVGISIHASRGGSDTTCALEPRPRKNFNPRFPWGKRLTRLTWLSATSAFQSTLPVGEATCDLPRAAAYFAFQSTLPVGEATMLFHGGAEWKRNFNPRFPWGKRPSWVYNMDRRKGISIHASRGGSDIKNFLQNQMMFDFNPRFPWGKRHPLGRVKAKSNSISIHASRGGSDTKVTTSLPDLIIFQSTLPVGEAT